MVGVDESWGVLMDGCLVRYWWLGEEVVFLVFVLDSWENFWEMGSIKIYNLVVFSNYGIGNICFLLGRLD